MAMVSAPGGLIIPYGPSNFAAGIPGTNSTAAILDAADEAAIMSGYMITSDGGSHTINTSGSSSIQWLCSLATFANAGTTVKVGLAAVDTANGPPGRAVNVADVITFDVVRTMTGGSGDITAAWKTHVPTSGSKTIANGDLVALGIQMTSRGGTDSIRVAGGTTLSGGQPTGSIFTQFAGGVYSQATAYPDAVVQFSDGAFGWFYGSDIYSTISTRAYNSGSSPNEYGQLYTLPFPAQIVGIRAWVTPTDNFEAVLYSDPLGTPVAQRTVAVDANTVGTATARPGNYLFSSPYSAAAGAAVAAIIKPTTGTNISAYYKLIDSAGLRVTDAWGTTGYGVDRGGGSGAFVDAGSSLEHYYAGLLLGGFDNGAGGGGGGAHFSAAFG